jgi:hypothetical protein
MGLIQNRMPLNSKSIGLSSCQQGECHNYIRINIYFLIIYIYILKRSMQPVVSAVGVRAFSAVLLDPGSRP